MFKLFSSPDGEEILIQAVNKWLQDNPQLSVQSFDYHTYYRSQFASEEELIHCLMIHYTILEH